MAELDDRLVEDKAELIDEEAVRDKAAPGGAGPALVPSGSGLDGLPGAHAGPLATGYVARHGGIQWHYIGQSMVASPVGHASAISSDGHH